MKAAWRDKYGGPDIVEIRDIPIPVLQEGQVLVRVKAASVNRADLDGLYPRWKFIRLFLGLRAPRPSYRRLGIDMAGTVEAVGEGVTLFKPGDDVFADLSAHGQGTFAEYVCAKESAFAPMPPTLSYEQAACLPHSGVLAVRAFTPRGGRVVGAGERVLVVGASGNVGPYCIQIAKSLGAHVTGVASAGKLDFVRSLGADEVIDYRTTDYTRPAQPYDWIVEVDAHYPARHWLAALKPGGVQLAFGGPASYIVGGALASMILPRFTGKHVGLAMVSPFGDRDVAQIKEYVAAGVLRPVIDRRFTLDEAADALRYVDEARNHGKVVVTVA